MNLERTQLPDLLLLEPELHRDLRGFFYESFNRRRFAADTGLDVDFVQDNLSRSRQNVVRGLHYQIRQPQGKLVSVLAGEIYDVAVDLRRSSPAFGRWFGVTLSADNRRQLWIPPDFAHGFAVLGASADVFYKTTDYYAPEHERCLQWDDPALGIAWPLSGSPVLSDKDRQGQPLAQAEVFA